MNLMTSNWDSILVVLLFIVALIVMLRKGYSREVNEILFSLVFKAEKELGGGTGKLKYAQVVEWLYEKLPFILRIVFTSKEIDLMIEGAVQRMKKYLEKNMDARVMIMDAPTIKREVSS